MQPFLVNFRIMNFKHKKKPCVSQNYMSPQIKNIAK